MPASKPETEIRGLATIARRAGDGAVSREAHLRGRERLIAAIDRAAPPRSWAWLRLSLAAATMVAIALVLVARRAPPAITFAIDGATATQRYVEAGPGGATLRFSEGTTIALAKGARARVDATSPVGARVSVESGSARFDVVHRDRASWTVEAGPFTVAVTGTSFDLGWNGAEIAVAMHAGSVIVRGPPAPEGIALRGGQRLVADAQRVSVSPIASASPAASAGPSAIATASAPSSAEASASPADRRPPSLSWRARVASGDYAGVIAEAEARGIDASLESSSLADLSALADAARYAGKGALAQRALVATRNRFPGSAEALTAAFLLGRAAESKSPMVAVTWYDRYLAEAPGGSLAAEALGRKMIALRAASGPAAARETAAAYARRFPDGPFAKVAAEILGDP
jgi:hypothetical protein